MREEKTVDLRCPFDKVWDAALRVFELTQWRVREEDKAAGRYEVLVDIPTDQLALPVPLVEKFQIDITGIDANSTKVHAAIRFEQWHWGTTAYYVNFSSPNYKNNLTVKDKEKLHSLIRV